MPDPPQAQLPARQVATICPCDPALAALTFDPIVALDRRLFVLNIAWATTDAQLHEHLQSAFPAAGAAVSASAILRWPDGRSRGMAKVVMRAAIDVDAVIEALDRVQLGGRALLLHRDRLQPHATTQAAAYSYSDFEECD